MESVALINPSTLNLKKESRPFIYTAFVWLGFSAIFTHGLSPWLVLLWLLCAADLAAITFTFRAVFGIMMSSDEAPEKRPAYILNASVWGTIKLACLGLFAIVLFRGQNIPSRDLLLGLGTMVVVPLVGGFWWSQKVLNNA